MLATTALLGRFPSRHDGDARRRLRSRATAEVDAARELGDRIGETDATSVWCDQRWQIARHQSDRAAIHELSDFLREVGDPHWVMYETLIAVELADLERANLWAHEAEALGERWPRWAARLWLTFLTQLAILRDDHAAIDSLIETLTPDADRWAVLGGGVIVDGPMSFWLGRLEQARGDHERAATWFAQAEASARRLGSHLWTVEARTHRVAAQHELGTATTAELASVIGEAEQIGLHPVARRLRSLTTTAAPNIFRLDHDVWTLAWGGVEVRMPDAKGLRDLHTLVANPSVEISAVDLATGGTAPPRRRRRFSISEPRTTTGAGWTSSTTPSTVRPYGNTTTGRASWRPSARRSSTSCVEQPDSAGATAASTTRPRRCARPSRPASVTRCASSTTGTRSWPPTCVHPCAPGRTALTHRPRP